MRKFLFAAALLPIMGLAACSGFSTILNDPNVEICAAALVQTGITDPAQLAFVAATTPACTQVAAEVIQQLIADVSKTNTAAAARRGMRIDH